MFGRIISPQPILVGAWLIIAVSSPMALAEDAPTKHDTQVAAVTQVQAACDAWGTTLDSATDQVATLEIAAATAALSNAKTNLIGVRSSAQEALAQKDDAAVFPYKLTQVKLRLTFTKASVSRAFAALAHNGHGQDPVALTLVQFGNDLATAAATIDVGQ